MEYKNKIIPTKILLSLDGSESFIVRRLKGCIVADPIQFGCATYGDLKGKKYEIDYNNTVNNNDILKSIEFIYYRDGENSPEYFELKDLYTNNIKITEPVQVDHKLILFGDNEGNVEINKSIEFFIRVKDTYNIKIIGSIRVAKCKTPENISGIFNKIASVVLVDRYAFIGYKFKINDGYISMKIDYTNDYDIREGYFDLIKLLEDALESYYAPLRKLAKK